MCGIVAYIGNKEAFPILIEGLRRLEYRGYDSAGVALVNGDIQTIKKKGKVAELEKASKAYALTSNLGIGHTRWATHGEPNDINAHPHSSGDGRIAIVHNGIIENYATIKKALVSLGHTFESETDTEVLAHLIEEYLDQNDIPLEEAVRLALGKAIGAYAIVVVDKKDPNKIVGARKSSPLVLGIGDGETFLASDATPIIKYTNQVVYIKDEEIVTAYRDGTVSIRNIQNESKDYKVEQVDLKLEELEKGGFDHFMLKEIHQQPETIYETLRGRLNSRKGLVKLGGLMDHMNRLARAERIIIIACGTS